MVHRETYDPARVRSDTDIRQFLRQQTRLGKFGAAAREGEES